MKVRTAAPRSRATTLGTSRRAFIRGDLLADLESRVSMLVRDPRNEQERIGERGQAHSHELKVLGDGRCASTSITIFLRG
jgi:hypothetical protein